MEQDVGDDPTAASRELQQVAPGERGREAVNALVCRRDAAQRG
jgi:hypothetical protein